MRPPMRRGESHTTSAGHKTYGPRFEWRIEVRGRPNDKTGTRMMTRLLRVTCHIG